MRHVAHAACMTCSANPSSPYAIRGGILGQRTDWSTAFPAIPAEMRTVLLWWSGEGAAPLRMSRDLFNWLVSNCLVIMVEVLYPFPFRTRKSSPLTPMILRLEDVGK